MPIIGDDASNLLLGADSNDQIDGLGGNDALLGGGGNDTLTGGTGADYLNGGSGLDIVDYGASSAILVDLANHNAIGGEAFGDSLISIEGVFGTQQGDFLIGDGQQNILAGRGGADVLRGAGGDDAIAGGQGADVIEGGDGNDTAEYRESAAGVIVSLAAGTASGGDAAGDSLDSIENITGSIQADVITGDAKANVLLGAGGNDQVAGGGGNDRILASGIINGNGGNDTVSGSDGADTIAGGVGRDIITGSDGPDQMSGGAGADLFHYFSSVLDGSDDSQPGARQDLILDFTQAENDRIDLHEIFDNAATPIDETLTFIGAKAFSGTAGELRFIANAVQNVSFIQADLDGDGSTNLQVKFTGPITFTAADFIL